MNMAAKNKIFDIVLIEALKEYMDMEFKRIDEIVLDEPHEPSPQFERNIKRITNSVGRKDRIKKFMRGCTKTVMSLAAVFGIFFGALLTQPSVFAAVQNVFRSVFDKYDKYEFADNEDLKVENFDDKIRLGYVPDGYYLSEGFYSPAYVSLTYTDEKDNKIELNYGIADSLSISYDNEHNTYYGFDRNGISYHYYESNDSDFYSTLTWYENGYSFSILAHLPKDELIKMAENIEK